MLNKKNKKKADNGTYASVRNEMAKPRMARSARIAEQERDIERIAEQPSTTMSGVVEKIIASPRPNKPEKAEIVITEADKGHRALRFENTLTDENGDDAKLKKGARVEVTVTPHQKPAST